MAATAAKAAEGRSAVELAKFDGANAELQASKAELQAEVARLRQQLEVLPSASELTASQDVRVCVCA